MNAVLTNPEYLWGMGEMLLWWIKCFVVLSMGIELAVAVFLCFSHWY